MAQSSGTPFNHLRMAYPETFKTLCTMLDESGAPLNNKPVIKKPPPVVTAEEELRIEDDRKKRLSDSHALSMLVKTRRNPFGSWYEGLPTNHKISVQYDKWWMTSEEFPGAPRSGVYVCLYYYYRSLLLLPTTIFKRIWGKKVHEYVLRILVCEAVNEFAFFLSQSTKITNKITFTRFFLFFLLEHFCWNVRCVFFVCFQFFVVLLAVSEC